jgi:Ni,Fe-hydrogenase maturation factor
MKAHVNGLKHIIGLHKALGHMPKGLIDIRMDIFDSLMRVSKEIYTNHDDIYNAL